MNYIQNLQQLPCIILLFISNCTKRKSDVKDIERTQFSHSRNFISPHFAAGVTYLQFPMHVYISSMPASRPASRYCGVSGFSKFTFLI